MCCRSQFLLRASCSDSGVVNGVTQVASVRRQQDVIAIGRCSWLTALLQRWAVQEKIWSGGFSDAWRKCDCAVCALDPDPDPYPNLLCPEQSLRDRVLFPACSLPSPQAAADGMQLLLRGRDGRDRLVDFPPAGNSCPRETSAQSIELKPFQKLPALSDKTWMWWFGFT